MLFTFYYIYIKTSDPENYYALQVNLHSTIFILKQSETGVGEDLWKIYILLYLY